MGDGPQSGEKRSAKKRLRERNGSVGGWIQVEGEEDKLAGGTGFHFGKKTSASHEADESVRMKDCRENG